MSQLHHLSVWFGLCIAAFASAHGRMHSPNGAAAEESHISRSRKAGAPFDNNHAMQSDFTISCQTDRILFELDQAPKSIVRRCTINSFGPFADSIALSCDSSSLSGVDCEMSPRSMMITNDPSEKDVTVTIHASDDVPKEDGGEILISASYDADTRSSSIPVIIGDQPDDIPPIENDGGVDLFLLSGQSNMHGHTTSGSSIGSNDDYWLEVKSILEAGGDPIVMENDLADVIYAAQTARNSNWPQSVATLLADETIKLYTAGLLNNLDTPLSLGSCSFVVPRDAGGVDNISGGTKPTAWNSECGGSFGHELIFSRTLEMEMDQQTSFETVKNARGGTQIHKHWYPGYGSYWDELKQSIASRSGWKGFIWHQGTQEAWTQEDTSLTYLANLTGLIQQVRVEMFDASEAGAWQCKEEIPVVVVQIGYWPQIARAQRVREAQAQYCVEDSRAELVTTYDLSRFYHFDAPSFLIGGHRIAQAYQRALLASVTCPSTAPTPNPTPCAGVSLNVDVLTDNYPGETSWTLTNNCATSPVVNDPGYSLTGTSYSNTYCLPPAEYTFIITDSYGDGICCSYGSGSYSVKYEGVIVASGGAFGDSDSTTFGSCGLAPTSPPTSPPTIFPTKSPTDAPSSSPTTKSPTKSPSSAPSSSPTETPTPNPTTPPPTPCPGVEITVDILTDSYPLETSWNLTNTCTDQTQEFVNADIQYKATGTQYSSTYCVPSAEYRFEISDSYGDGICCSYGIGNYSLFLDGFLVASGGVFGSSESATFGSCGPVPTKNPTSQPTTLLPTPTPTQVVATFDSSLRVPKCSVVGSSCTSGPLLLDGSASNIEPNPSNTLDSCTDGPNGAYHDDESIDEITVYTVEGGLLQAGAMAEIEAKVWAWQDGSADTADFYYAVDTNDPNWQYIGSVGAGGLNLRTLRANYTLPDSALQAVRVNYRYGGGTNACTGGSWDDVDDLVFPVAARSAAAAAFSQKPLPIPPAKSMPSSHCATIDKWHKNRCDENPVCEWKSGRDKGCYPKN